MFPYAWCSKRYQMVLNKKSAIPTNTRLMNDNVEVFFYYYVVLGKVCKPTFLLILKFERNLIDFFT